MMPSDYNARGNKTRLPNQTSGPPIPSNGYSAMGRRPQNPPNQYQNQHPPSHQTNNMKPQMMKPQMVSSSSQGQGQIQYGHQAQMSRQRANVPGRPTNFSDPRKYVISQIQKDCYSKFITVDGQTIPEVKYNTHLAIREYSLFPSSRPPADLSPAQLGTTKNRILVVSTKYTGRVLLQKGKYAEGKRVYQIGRTWDLDELVCITRLSADEVILHLNKNYYWKSGEGPDRLAKFIHHLAVIYHKFSGHYPELKGITLAELKLAPASIPDANGTANSSIRAPAQSRQPNNSDLYKNMDFTVNGTLPSKPMQVMDVDRPSPRAQQNSQFFDTSSYKSELDGVSSEKQHSSASSLRNGQVQNLPYETSQENQSVNDSQSFIFGADESQSEESQHMPSISEYARENGSQSPLRNYKPEKSLQTNRNVSENLETAASYGLQLQDQLEHPEVSSDSIKFQFEAPDLNQTEETEIPERDQIKPPDQLTYKVHDTSESLPDSLSKENKERSAIDSSIKDIEDFMDSQFGRSTPNADHVDQVPEVKERPVTDTARQSKESFAETRSTHSKKSIRAVSSVDESIDDSRSNFSYEENSLSTRNPESMETSETDIDVTKADQTVFERDAEIDEVLDEIGWDAADGSDKALQLLRQELTTIKHKSVKQLTTLNFGKDSLIKEVSVSVSELDNLVDIFERMEASLNLLSPVIGNIEENSKGLQVEAVNKKILYNELNEILNKVRLSGRDLESVANFDDFEDIPMIPLLEGKLLMLYDALVAMGSKSSDDNLTQMKALKQFCEEYELVASSFSEKFMIYVVNEFRSTIDKMNSALDTVEHDDILVELRKIYAFEGINNFVKCVSEKTSIMINDKFSSYMASFVDNLLAVKMKSVFSNSRNSAQRNFFRFSDDGHVGLRKAKSTRFGSNRLLGKFGNAEEHHKQKPASAAIKNGEEIGDPHAILQMLDDSRDLMLVTQFFFGLFFHSTSMEEFSDYVRQTPYDDRMKLFERREVDVVDYKTNSNELMRNMNQVFGNYINRFIKKMVPSDLLIPQLLLEVYYRLKDADLRSQDFVAYSFLLKIANRYKNSWNKCIASQVDLLNKSDIRGRGEILPSVKNLSHVILTTETALQESHRDIGEFQGDFDKLIHESYEKLTKGAVDLFEREDPLLKSNNHDERERAHRNVAILQNLFTLLQQLNEFDTKSAVDMRQRLEEVFNETRGEYFRYLVQRHFGKIYDYVRGHEGDSSAIRKKEDKILVKGIASTHSARDVAQKISEIRRKMEKHIVTTNTVFEQDLFEAMWKDMENEVSGLFESFYGTAHAYENDLEGCVSPREIRRLFH